MVQTKNDKGFGDQYDMAGEKEVRNKYASRFPARDKVGGSNFTDKGKIGGGVLTTEKVKKRKQYNINTSTLPGYYTENATKIAI